MKNLKKFTSSLMNNQEMKIITGGQERLGTMSAIQDARSSQKAMEGLAGSILSSAATATQP